jgi:hypothetical protein
MSFEMVDVSAVAVLISAIFLENIVENYFVNIRMVIYRSICSVTVMLERGTPW